MPWNTLAGAMLIWSLLMPWTCGTTQCLQSMVHCTRFFWQYGKYDTWQTRRGRTHEDHGGALGHHEGQHHVAHLALPKGIDAIIAGLPFLPAVPAEVVIGAVSILLTICLVVLAVVGHQVMQGVAIMSYDEVDALVRLPASHTVFLTAMLTTTYFCCCHYVS